MRWWKAVSDTSKTIVAIGAGLIGVAASTQGYLAASIRETGIWIGLVLCAGGIILGGASIYTRMRRAALAQSIRASALSRVYKAYTRRAGALDDVAEVYELGISVVGVEYHIPPTHLAELMKAADGVLSIVERDSGGRRQLAGYFVIYPLKASACDRILTGDIVSGFAIRPSHLQSSFAKAKGIYIAQVTAAASPLDRTAVLVYLHDFVAQIISDAGSPLAYVFTRPGTKSGQKWVDTLSFAPIPHPHSLIWMLERKAIRKVFGQPSAAALPRRRNAAGVTVASSADRAP
jgi:hypothetical protein